MSGRLADCGLVSLLAVTCLLPLLQVTCPGEGVITIQGQPAAAPCCGITTPTGTGTSGLFLYAGTYDSTASMTPLVRDTANLSYTAACKAGDKFSVCEQFGIIRVNTLLIPLICTRSALPSTPPQQCALATEHVTWQNPLRRAPLAPAVPQQQLAAIRLMRQGFGWLQHAIMVSNGGWDGLCIGIWIYAILVRCKRCVHCMLAAATQHAVAACVLGDPAVHVSSIASTLQQTLR